MRNYYLVLLLLMTNLFSYAQQTLIKDSLKSEVLGQTRHLNLVISDTVGKARKIGEGRYSVTCRGCEYASFWENHNYKWTFEDEMRMANIEFIEPNI